MYVVMVEFTTHPENFDAFLARVRRQAEDSLRLEPGCQVFDVCVDPGQNGFVILYEVYSNKKAFDAHLDSAYFHDFNDTVQDWIRDKKVSTFERI